MRVHHFAIASLWCVFACLFALLPSAVPQEKYDRDAYAREYVQFLVQELDQWTKGFLASSIQRFCSRRGTPANYRKAPRPAPATGRSGETIGVVSTVERPPYQRRFSKPGGQDAGRGQQVNLAMSSQRFPDPLQSDWEQMRTALNSLAEIYKVEYLAALEPPRSGTGGRGGSTAAAAVSRRFLQAPWPAILSIKMLGPARNVDGRGLHRAVYSGRRQTGAGDRRRQGLPDRQPG